jgi:Tol biopolymer transport system component
MIAFTCTRDEINQICTIRADGSGYEQLTSGTANSYYPAVSPDGRHITYAVNLYDTFDLYRLSPGVVEGPRNTESRVKRLTDYIGNAFSPSYSPDGDQIAFVNRVSDEPATLWIMGSDGTDPHAVSALPGALVAAEWSPDGRSIAVAAAVERTFSHEVFVLDLENLVAPPKKVPSTLAGLGGSLAWSPDQSHLLVFAGPAAAREIYRLDVASGQATQLTFGGNNASACYSPDGQNIVFNSLRNGGQADLYVMRADGHSMRRLTDNAEPDWQPKWGP